MSKAPKPRKAKRADGETWLRQQLAGLEVPAAVPGVRLPGGRVKGITKKRNFC